ncbi:hypothetical protein WMF18_15400 [Sorangium sp. So ce315]|uniref:hypothetical protein n=1 Tax=Sorangium sp. So ce315 TaxID=3133299 RepID=UPI003F5EB6D5
MNRTALPARRALLVALSTLALGVPCCAGANFAPSSEVEGLRVLAVTADRPYTAAPLGGGVTFEMTYADAPAAGAGPRPVQIMWLGGCVNPPAGIDEQIGCLPQLLGAAKEFAPGGAASNGENEEAEETPRLFDRDDMTAEQSGEPGKAKFKMVLPDDIFEGARRTETGNYVATAYVFFTVCAGTTRVASSPLEAGFPLECVGEDGAVLGPDSFVVGYTQVYVFAHPRTNTNPPVTGLTVKLGDAEVALDDEGLPVVERCARPEETQAQGCSPPAPEGDGCTAYDIEAIVGDVAERDDEAAGLGAPDVREAIWVDYYTDGGGFDGARRLVSDTTRGFLGGHGTTWTPPSEPGRVSLWAVVHDTRGGASVVRREVRVE